MEGNAMSRPRGRRSQTGAINVLLLAAILVLAFAALTYVGTYVQWSDAVRTTASIQDAEQQWARRGSGNLRLAVTYPVEGQENPLAGELSVSPERLEGRDLADGIDVYYMKSKPTRVTAVDTLEDKRDNIPYMLGIGGLLGIVGMVSQVRRRRAASA
jgi:hypothetical protein